MPKRKPFFPDEPSETKSPALQLVELVWREAPVRSWMRLNHTMQDALSTAIKAGLRFDQGDIETMWTKMRGPHWFTGAENEWIHGLAVRHNNTSAAVAYEKWVGRGPFFLEGRLHVGRSVDFGHIGVDPPKDGPGCAIVSSFAEDGQSVIVCVYADHLPLSRGDGIVWPSGKPVKRIRLTIERVREMEKARKSAPPT